MIPAFGKEINTCTSPQRLYGEGNSKLKGLLQVEFDVSNPLNWPWGGEPVTVNGKVVGNLSSIGYGVEGDAVVGLVVIDKDGLIIDDSVTVQVGADNYKGNIVAMT